jgi:hypothetical protein
VKTYDKAYDFVYENKKLSDFGFIICNFGDKGLDMVSDGSQISFNTVSVLGGGKSELTSAQYEECLGGTMQICKYSCADDVQEITPAEHRNITRWLNRKKFLKFKPLSKEFIDLYFEASFNISRIELDGRLVGLELEVFTNRPFALKEPITINVKNLEQDGKHSINDISHEEGFIYPLTEITISEDGNLKIHNAIENRDTYIANCKKGEVITMDYPVISSSISSHNIQNDFNWVFFRIANTYENSRNDLTISLPCSIKATYSPIVKVGL